MANRQEMKRLYVFRHGETDWNLEKRVQGRSDVPLNETGRRQAAELRDALSDKGLEIIYSSPLLRALETAEAVAGRAGIEVRTHDGINERNCGILEGHIARIEMPELNEKMLNPDFAPPGGESSNDVGRRATAAIIDIAKNSKHNIIGISTHHGIARTILQNFTEKIIHFRGIPNCAYYRLDWDGGKLALGEIPEWLDGATEEHK